MKKKYILLVVFFLEILAIKLALLQMWIGVRTDEAKYLLNIPYPHPPLLRWIISLTESLPFQEIFWRILLATLLIQAVWLVWDMSRNYSRSIRLMICASWILSAAVLLQAGTVMMAPVTALQALVFLWIGSRPRITQDYPEMVALLWLASLFTAYQIILFCPVILFLFLRARISFMRSILFVGIPVLLLALFTFGHPLSLASFMIQGTKDIRSTPIDRFMGLLHVWILGGSIVLGLLGTIGIFFSKKFDLMSSFLLVIAFILLAKHDYYAILFTPLFVVGIMEIFKRVRNRGGVRMEIFLVAMICAGLIGTIILYPPSFARGTVRDLVRQIPDQDAKLDILIKGSFGHEWQYESRRAIRKFSIERLPDAAAVICLEPCPEMEQKNGWRRQSDVPPVWIAE